VEDRQAANWGGFNRRSGVSARWLHPGQRGWQRPRHRAAEGLEAGGVGDVGGRCEPDGSWDAVRGLFCFLVRIFFNHTSARVR
jgi:hypothetical protein